MHSLVNLVHNTLDIDILSSLDSADSLSEHTLAMQIQTIRILRRLEEKIDLLTTELNND